MTTERLIAAARAVAHAAANDVDDLYHMHPCCNGTIDERHHYGKLLDELVAAVQEADA